MDPPLGIIGLAEAVGPSEAGGRENPKLQTWPTVLRTTRLDLPGMSRKWHVLGEEKEALSSSGALIFCFVVQKEIILLIRKKRERV